LAEWLTQWLSREVRVDVAGTYAEMVDAICAGETELAWTPPVVFAGLHGATRFALTAQRQGVCSSRGAIIVRRGDPAGSIAELQGRRAAWVDPLSMSGHLSALSQVRRYGLEASSLFGQQRYYGSYSAALQAVLDNEADVTSVYGELRDQENESVRKVLQDLAGPRAMELRVLERTGPFPYDALVGTLALSEVEAQPLRDALLALRHSPSAPSMLLDVCACEGFVPAEPAAYAWLAATPSFSAARRTSRPSKP
jgi:phosphonate transport system substrate-binding protein